MKAPIWSDDAVGRKSVCVCRCFILYLGPFYLTLIHLCVSLVLTIELFLYRQNKPTETIFACIGNHMFYPVLTRQMCIRKPSYCVILIMTLNKLSLLYYIVRMERKIDKKWWWNQIIRFLLHKFCIMHSAENKSCKHFAWLIVLVSSNRYLVSFWWNHFSCCSYFNVVFFFGIVLFYQFFTTSMIHSNFGFFERHLILPSYYLCGWIRKWFTVKYL